MGTQTSPENPPLSKRIRPDVEAAPWVCNEIIQLEAQIKELKTALGSSTKSQELGAGCGDLFAKIPPSLALGAAVIARKLEQQRQSEQQVGKAVAWQVKISGRWCDCSETEAREYSRQTEIRALGVLQPERPSFSSTPAVVRVLVEVSGGVVQSVSSAVPSGVELDVITADYDASEPDEAGPGNLILSLSQPDGLGAVPAEISRIVSHDPDRVTRLFQEIDEARDENARSNAKLNRPS
ncbi:MAG: hypothetical protein EPN79_11700 [Burkholderiaceae bacterium]|nr:MAG: hypothetical protein EPN79_11700 [Burkholderiaceae bacterium]TBR76679.1 MAG: hypothetical protein EPN64_05365 [Burkholderiaceae bacterium]